MMNKEIKALCNRFMAGETTVNEEKRLAEYFRTHICTTDEERTLRAMFTWFENDMPMNGDKPELRLPEKTPVQRSRKTVIAWLSAAACIAALAGVFFMTRPATDAPLASAAQQQQPETNTSFSVKADTTALDTVRTVTQPRKKARKKIYRYRYNPAPPKVYIAEARADSMSRAGDIKADIILTEMETRQNEYLLKLEQETLKLNQGLDAYTASLESEEPETEENEVY